MTSRMLPRRLLVPLAFSLLSTALLLGAAAWNRRGVETVITLTARELASTSPGLHYDYDSSLLTLAYQDHLYGVTTDSTRLSEAAMRAIGFTCDPRLDDARNVRPRQACARERDRVAFVVFEYDGPAWQAHLAQLEQAAVESSYLRDALEPTRKRGSRLVPVDAGLDTAALRARYADRARYLILAARVKADVEMHERPGDRPLPPRERSLRGQVVQVTPPHVSAPLTVRAELLPHHPALGTEALEAWPRHTVRLAVGRRMEPWIEEVRPLP